METYRKKVGRGLLLVHNARLSKRAVKQMGEVMRQAEGDGRSVIIQAPPGGRVEWVPLDQPEPPPASRPWVLGALVALATAASAAVSIWQVLG